MLVMWSCHQMEFYFFFVADNIISTACFLKEEIVKIRNKKLPAIKFEYFYGVGN